MGGALDGKANFFRCEAVNIYSENSSELNV